MHLRACLLLFLLLSADEICIILTDILLYQKRNGKKINLEASIWLKLDFIHYKTNIIFRKY